MGLKDIVSTKIEHSDTVHLSVMDCQLDFVLDPLCVSESCQGQPYLPGGVPVVFNEGKWPDFLFFRGEWLLPLWRCRVSRGDQ